MTVKKCKNGDCKHKGLTLDQWIEKSYKEIEEIGKEYKKKTLKKDK